MSDCFIARVQDDESERAASHEHSLAIQWEVRAEKTCRDSALAKWGELKTVHSMMVVSERKRFRSTALSDD